MNNKRFGALSSSVDPNKLSETVESVLKILGGIAVTLGVISTPQLTALLGQWGILVPAAFALWNAGNAIFGILRKAVVAVAEKK